MDPTTRNELYQEMILEHHKKPRNLKKLEHATHTAEGYNPLCGDHINIYLKVNDKNIIEEVSFLGDGCAISRASASMMTISLKGKTVPEALNLFDQFHKLILGELKPETNHHNLGKLTTFSGIWQFPSRVKCATLSWHTMKGALNKEKMVSTE